MISAQLAALVLACAGIGLAGYACWTSRRLYLALAGRRGLCGQTMPGTGRGTRYRATRCGLPPEHPGYAHCALVDGGRTLARWPLG